MESGKSRRSSILKPQKARNPLSDLDFTEAVEDISMVITGRPSMRRVSFASSNFVKEFATDPEKNTIWDSTYEETVNSDSTQSSENAHNTLGMQHTQCSDSVQITNENIHCVTMSNDENPKLISTSDQLNQVYGLYAEETAAKSQKTVMKERTAITTANSIQQLHPRKASINFNDQESEDIKADSSLFDIGRSRNILEKENVQLTIGKRVTKILPKDKDVALGATRKEKSVVSFTHTNKDMMGALSSDKENQMYNNFHSMTPQFSGVTLSNLPTEVDRSLNKENINILSNDIRCISNKRNFQIANDNMKVMPSVSLTTESSFRNSKNMTVTDDTSMEFTRHVTRSSNGSYKVYGNRTVMSDISMEVTRHVVSRLVTNTEVVENRTITSEDDMEFTQQITDINIEDLEKVQNTLAATDDNMEFTQHISSSLNKTIRDETIMSEENMEYTRAVGVIDSTQNKTVTSDEVEVNENVAILNKEKLERRSSKTVKDIRNMEFIPEWPIVNKPNFESTRNKSAIQEENMELTQQDEFSRRDSKIVQNKFAIGDMSKKPSETSLKISSGEGVVNKPHFESARNKTTLQDENMELTQQDVFSRTDSKIVQNKFENNGMNVETSEAYLKITNCEGTNNTTISQDVNDEPVELKNSYSKTNSILVENESKSTDPNREFASISSVLHTSGAEVMKNVSVKSNDWKLISQPTRGVIFENVKNTTVDVADNNLELIRHPTSLQGSFRNLADKDQISDCNMELTKGIFDLSQSNYKVTQNETIEEKDNKNEAINVNDGNEFTNKEMPLKTSFRNSVDKQQISDINMQFSEVISALNKSHCEGTKNETIDVKDDMDFLPGSTPLPRNFRSSADKQQNMNFTEVMFDLTKSNYEGTKSDTIGMKDDMEFISQPTPLRRSLTNSADKQQISDNMEFTEVISALNKSNYDGAKNEDPIEIKANVEFTPHQPTPLHRSFTNSADKQQISDVNMEFTEVISALNKSNYGGPKNDIIGMKDDLEFTPQPTPLRRSLTTSANVQQISDNMEFTEVISALNKSNYGGPKNDIIGMKDDLEFTPQPTPLRRSLTTSANVQQISDNMEFTEVISALNKSNYDGPKNEDTIEIKDNVEFTPLHRSFTNSADKQQISDVNMEFTEVISALNKSNCDGPRNEDTIEIKDNVEFTPHQPTPLHRSFTNSADKQQISDVNMEFTEVISALNKSNYDGPKNEDTIEIKDNVEFTPHQPTPLHRSFTNLADKQQISDVIMEFTEVISALNKSNYGGPKNDTIGMKDDMEFTPQPTPLRKSLTNSANDQQISDNMEFTEVISALNKSNYEGAKSETIGLKDDMEFSPQPTPLQRSLTNSADKQQISDNMEFTEVICALNKSNYEGTKSDTIGLKDDMEFTPQPTPLQRSLTNSADKQQLSDNMEFTEVISALNKLNYEGTKNDSSEMKDDMEFTPQVTPLQRSLTNSGDKQQISDNMEFTEIISALNKSNYGGTKSDTIGMKDDMEFTPQPTPLQRSLTNSADEQQISDNMEFTEVISALNKSNYGGAKSDTVGMKDDMEFTPQPTPLQRSLTNSADKQQISDNMEFTGRISALNKSNYGGAKSDTIGMKDDMEFTPQPTPLQRSLTNSADEQQISDNMEFTEVISALNKSNYGGAKSDTVGMKDDMEFTPQPTPLQRSLTNSADKQHISDNMEFAEVISALNKSNYEGTKNDIIGMKNDMEFTSQPTPLHRSLPNLADKQQSENTEFTEVISALNKSNYDGAKNEDTIGMKDNMEFTHQPTLLQRSFTNSANKQRISENMEFTEVISALNKSNYEAAKNDTIDLKNDMEFIPQPTLLQKRNSSDKPQISDVNMEFIEVISALDKSNYEAAKNDTIDLKNDMEFIPQPTLLQKRNSSDKPQISDVNMEFTEVISALNISHYGGTKNDSIDMKDDMEFTPQLTPLQGSFTNSEDKQKISDVSKEFAEVISDLNKSNYESKKIEITDVKENHMEFSFPPTTLQTNFRNLVENEQISNVNMEFTKVTSALSKSNLEGTKDDDTINERNHNRVFTIQPTSLQTSCRNSEDKQLINNVNMKFAEIISPINKSNSESIRNETTKDDIVEVNSQPSLLNKTSSRNVESKLQRSDRNVEFAKVVFDLNKSNVHSSKAVTRDDMELTPVDKELRRNKEFTESPILSLSKADFRLTTNVSLTKSDHIEFTAHQSSSNTLISDNIKNKLAMSNTNTEFIQLQSSLNKTVSESTEKETISKGNDMNKRNSKNIENKVQVSDAELVLAPISDSERINTSVKDESMEATSKSFKTDYRNNANFGFTELEFNLNKSYPKVEKNKTIVKDSNKEVIQYLYPLNELSCNNIQDKNDMKFIESPCASLNKVSYEVAQNTTKCELQKNSSKMDCENMENVGNTTNTNMELNREETASRDINNFFGINYSNIDKDNERFGYETSTKAINKNENLEYIQPSSRKNYAKTDIHSDNQNMEISLHSFRAEPVAADFHKPMFPEHLHNLIESNKYNVVPRQIENHSLEIAKEVSSNESFAMDVDITPVKDTSRIKFSYPQIVNTHNINVTVRADKKKSMQPGLSLASNLSATSDCVNKVDPQLRENSHLQELTNSSFSKNISVNLFENSLKKLSTSINTCDKQENLQLSESSKHFDASIVGNEDGQITNSTSVEQALTGLRYLDAQIASTRANTVPHSICEFKTPGSSFHTSFIDDTQHLINYSLSNRQAKSDFSKIITGDLNPTFLSSKFMHLSDFSSCAFPISLDNTRNNQTHLDYTQTDKDKSCKDYYDDKPQQISCSVDNKTVALHGDTLSVLQETSRSNQTDLNDVEVTENMSCKIFENKPQQTTYVINSKNDKTYTLEDTISQKLEKGGAKDESCKELNDNQRHQVTYLINDKDNPSVKVEEIVKAQKRRSSENIEAAVECKKMLLDTTENPNLVNEALEMETSFNDQIKIEQNSHCSKGETVNISQENLTLSDSIDDSFLPISVAAQQVIGNITRSFNSQSIDCTDFTGEITENRFSSRSKALWETYLENNNSIRSTIEEFMAKTRCQLATIRKNSALFEEKCDEAMKKIRAPFKRLSFAEAQSSIGSSMEYSSNDPTMSDMVQEENPLLEVDMKIEKVLTLEEEIEKKCRRSKRYWIIFTKDKNKYEFYTLYKSIRLVVYFNMEVGIVNATEVYSHISDDSDAVALFVHKIFKERLSQKNIKSAVGDRYDILTLLDYVYMNMQKMLDILNEFDRYKKCFAMKMDRNFRVTLTIINTYLVNTWCISVDMADIDNITEDSVSAWAKVGTVKEAEIKNLVKSCPRGVVFLQSFIKNILEYVDLLKKRKDFLKMKMGNVGL